MNTMAEAHQKSDPWSLRAFIAENSMEFRPIAYYDKHLDCIRVQIRDCSVTEQRLNRFFTILKPMHPNEPEHAGLPEYVGLNIKGVRHLFERLGLKPKGVVRLVEILDRMVKMFPDRACKIVEEEVSRNREMQDLYINFAEAV
jgi:hypothetical protein